MWLSKHLISLISHFFFLIFYPEMIIFPRVCHCVMRSIFSGKLQCELYIRVSFSTFESRVGRLIRFLRSIKADYKEKIISGKEKLSYRILMSRKRLGLEMQWCHQTTVVTLVEGKFHHHHHHYHEQFFYQHHMLVKKKLRDTKNMISYLKNTK